VQNLLLCAANRLKPGHVLQKDESEWAEKYKDYVVEGARLTGRHKENTEESS